MGALEVLFAGLWHLWPFAAAGTAVVLLLIAAYVSPIGKRYLVEAAVIIAVAGAVYGWGVNGEAARCKSQQEAGTRVINQVVNKAIKHTKTPRARSAPDPWDQKDY